MGSYYAGVMNSDYDTELKHHGIVGQRWGFRRFQNEDGSLTPLGKERYYGSVKERKNLVKMINSRPRNTEAIKNLPQIRDAAIQLKAQGAKLAEESEKYDTVQNEVEDYLWGNEAVYEKWMNRAVDNHMKAYNIDPSRREEIYNWYKYDDGDQNEHGTFETFIRESGSPLARKYADAEKSFAKAYNELKNASDEYAKNILGEEGTSMDKFWVSYFIGEAAKDAGKSDASEQLVAGQPQQKGAKERFGNFMRGISNGETDSLSVKEGKLKRQMQRNVLNNTPYDDNWKLKNDNSPGVKEARLTEEFNKKIRRSSGEDAKNLSKAYIRDVAKARLESMGYDVTPQAIDNLMSKSWFLKTLPNSNAYEIATDYKKPLKGPWWT